MREAQLHLQVLALQRGTIADADQLQLLLVAVGNALDHVVDEGAGKAVQAPGLTGIVRTGDDDLLAFLADGHHGVELAGELALGALDRHDVAVDLHVDAGRNGNGLLADTRHKPIPSFPTRCTR